MLTLASAIEQTLARNPELRVYAPRLTAARARARDRRAAPAARAASRDSGRVRHRPSERLRHRRRRRSRCRRSSSSAASASCAPTPRTRARRSSTPSAQRPSSTCLAEVTRRFIHVAADQEHLALTMRATALAEDNVAAATARVAAARAPDVELRRARVTSARVAVEQEHAEHELLTSRRKLAAMWGDSEATFERVSADLYALPPSEGYEALVATPREQSRLRALRIRGAAARRRAARRRSARAHGPDRGAPACASSTTPTTRRSCSA